VCKRERERKERKRERDDGPVVSLIEGFSSILEEEDLSAMNQLGL